MSKRPPNEQESRLHQAALALPKQEISAEKAKDVIQDPKARQNALNFLLAVGLFKSLKDSKGNISFRAVSKGELVATKELSGEENLVLSHIKHSANEGIWTKHLKAKTNLHQTVIDRCLKTLIQKRLIKRVPSVQHPTRKIYMLEGLEPSIALTGGPWYTDNELDTEFIQHLMDACYKFIHDMSFPKRREAPEGALYPISNAPEYPSAQSIRNSLRKARLTETDLSVEHVEALLNVLVLDGKIEKVRAAAANMTPPDLVFVQLPAFGVSLWDSSAINDESDDESEKRARKKRKHDSDDSADERKRSKRKRKKARDSDDGDSSDDDSRSSPRKKSRRRRARSPDMSDESSSEDEKKTKKKRKSKRVSDDSDADSNDDSHHKSSKNKKKKRSRHSSDSEPSSESEVESRRSRSSRKTVKRSPSPWDPLGMDDSYGPGGGSVYRALREQVTSLGWSQAPCALCPSFEFCKPGGPVNPQECVYYDDYLTSKTMAVDQVDI